MTRWVIDWPERQAMFPDDRSADSFAEDDGFRALVDDLDAIVWEADAAMECFSFVSRGAEKLLGFLPARWVSSPGFWREHLYPDDLEDAVESRRAAVLEGREHVLEYRMIAADGRVVWLRDSARTVCPASRGGAVRLRGLMIDITDRRRSEESLREAKERYRELVERVNEAIFTLDERGIITYISPAIEPISGYAPAEVIGRVFSEFIDPRDLPALYESFQRTLSGNPEPSQYRVRTKAGGVRWLQSHSQLIRQGERVVGVRGVLTDITAQKHVENALRESEARYRDLFENASDLIFTVDLNGVFTSLNRATERALGLTQYEVGRLNLFQIVTPEFTELVRRMLLTARFEEVSLPCGIEIRTPAGNLVPIELGMRLIRECGEPVGLQGVARDLTERRKAEGFAASFRRIEEEASVSAALARVGEALISTTERAELLQRLCTLTTEVLHCDFSRTYLRDRKDDTYVPMATHGESKEVWEQIQPLRLPAAMIYSLGGDSIEHDNAIQVDLRKLPHHRLASVAAAMGATTHLLMPLRRGREIIGIHLAGCMGREELFSPQEVRIARGIAHMAALALESVRLMEELGRANRVKSEFLSTMSHELRTPLHHIVGLNELLAAGDFGPLTREQLETCRQINRSARRLLDLVEATLDLSRLEARRLPVNMETVDISALIKELKRELQQPAPLTVSWQVEPDLPAIITDRLKLRVILKNLISNAFKFTSHGRVSVVARKRCDGIEFEVSDTGIGIAPEHHDIIFEAFRQIDSSSTRPYEGAGLGLYIVRRLLEVLNGSVSLQSEPGKGSTFRVWVPLAPT